MIVFESTARRPVAVPLSDSSSHQEGFSWNIGAERDSCLNKNGFSSALAKSMVLASLLVVQPDAYADNMDSPYLKLGKIDTFYDRKDNGDFQVNSFLSTPVFKGGYGIIAPENGGQDTHYFGGYARPLLTHPELGMHSWARRKCSSATAARPRYRVNIGCLPAWALAAVSSTGNSATRTFSLPRSLIKISGRASGTFCRRNGRIFRDRIIPAATSRCTTQS